MKVFVSHLTEEAQLGLVLKTWIEAAFPGQIEVFVSTRDISSGEQWFERIREELVDAGALLVLCSKGSLESVWIYFESGAAFGRDISVIPICYGEVTRSTLPAPFSFFQGLNAETQEFGRELLEDVAKHLGIPGVPPIRYEDMTNDVRKALVDMGTAREGGDAEEAGWIDDVVAFKEKMESLVGFVAEFTSDTEEMTAKTANFNNQIEQSTGRGQFSGEAQRIQNTSRRFGKELNDYAGKIGTLNQNFDNTLPDVRISLLRMLTWEHLDTSQTSEEDVSEFLTGLGDMEQAIHDWKSSVNECCSIMEAMPNFQREMRRGSQRVLDQLGQLVLRLDSTLNMISEARDALGRRLGEGGAN